MTFNTGSAHVLVHAVLLLAAAGGLMCVAYGLAADSPRRASALLLLLATLEVLGLAVLAAAIRLQGLPYAIAAAVLLMLASGAEYLTSLRS